MITALLSAHNKSLGDGFTVRRLLPSSQRQSVGPFLFFDHFGPVQRAAGQHMDVRPHPHIGLATVTYLFDGAIMHRDSLGSVQRIEPGAVNWMTAGRGIVHSERTPEDLRNHAHTLHGLQLWAALPAKNEEVEPAFVHMPASDIPKVNMEGVEARILIGDAYAHTSPVATYAPTLYVVLDFLPGAQTMLPLAAERAVYPIDQAVTVDGSDVPQGSMAVVDGSARLLLAEAGGRVVIIGGDPLDGHRHLWWNFVSTRIERIEQAKSDWRSQSMGKVCGDTEFIALP